MKEDVYSDYVELEVELAAAPVCNRIKTDPKAKYACAIVV